MEENRVRCPSPDDLRRVASYERALSLVLACALLVYLLWLGGNWLWGHL